MNPQELHKDTKPKIRCLNIEQIKLKIETIYIYINFISLLDIKFLQFFYCMYIYIRYKTYDLFIYVKEDTILRILDTK